MNREILFRGKRLDNGEWVYGNLVRYANGDAEIWEIFNPDIYTDCRDWVIIPETVGQYTGLKDKNGVEIFYGDIVRMHQFLFDGSEYEKEIVGVIKQGDYGWTLSQIKNKEVNDHMGYENGEGETYLIDFYGLHEESFEKIGTKWDNPELLEV